MDRAVRGTEGARLDALHRTGILDTPTEALFDDLTEIASQICGTPISLITLVDAERQWFKSHRGLSLRETPRDLAFCHYTVQSDAPFIVPDATEDDRFADNALVTGAPNIRFYAGAPVMVGSERIGTICVIDREPRELDEGQVRTLESLARHASSLIALRSNEQQLRAFLDLAPDGVVVADADGTLRFANRRLAALAGDAPEAFVGSDLTELLGEEMARACLAAFSGGGVSGEGLWEVPATLRPRDGEAFPVDVSSGFVDVVGEPLVKIIIRDARAREAAEQALRRSRALLQSIIDNAPTGILVKDLSGRYLLANAAAADDFDLPLETILGATDAELGLSPERVARFAELDRRVLAHGPTTFRDVAPSGRHFLTVKFPLLDDDGASYGTGAVTTDLTEQVRAETEAADLQRRYEVAQRLEGLGHLAGGVAHDFNNLLAVIMAGAQFAEEAVEEHAEAVPALRAVSDDLADIRGAAERAARLTRQLLVFARRQPAAAEVLDVNDLVRETSHLLARTLGAAIDVQLDLDHEPCVIEADRSQLEQLLLNLAINARDAMPRGGTLSIRTRLLTLAAGEVDDLPAGPTVRLSVRDTGEGMAPEVVARAFEPFFSTRTMRGGTGLGLSTVYGAVRKAGGDVTIDSRPGGGTTFIVHIPALPQPDDDAAAHGDGPPPTVEGRRILLVEDQEVVRRITARMLERRGYRVRTADGVTAALQVLDAEGDVDLVISDVVLGERSGVDLAALLRTSDPGLPVLLMSGYPQIDEEPGAEPHPLLQKPFTEQELLGRVADLLTAADRSEA